MRHDHGSGAVIPSSAAARLAPPLAGRRPSQPANQDQGGPGAAQVHGRAEPEAAFVAEVRTSTALPAHAPIAAPSVFHP